MNWSLLTCLELGESNLNLHGCHEPAPLEHLMLHFLSYLPGRNPRIPKKLKLKSPKKNLGNPQSSCYIFKIHNESRAGYAVVNVLGLRISKQHSTFGKNSFTLSQSPCFFAPIKPRFLWSIICDLSCDFRSKQLTTDMTSAKRSKRLLWL